MNPYARPVRVSRNGNSRTLTIPTEVVEAQAIETGELFCVEASADAIVYRRLKTAAPWRMVGEGAERYVALSSEAVIVVGPDPSPRPSTDWDY